jgi:predicted alpha/beta superfamily hydrolase
MHDGQNLFDSTTSHVGEWHVDKTLDKLFYEKSLSGIIVVGIDNGRESRIDEYIPSKKGRYYACFISNTLKPYIDKRFRTLPGREYTGVMGSSLGGLISLYMGAKYPHIFSKIGAVSPAMYFSGDSLKNVSRKLDMKIYMDVGTKEDLPYTTARQYADDVWKTYFQLICAGFSSDEMRLIVDKDAAHCEAAWSRRFASTIKWLYA